MKDKRIVDDREEKLLKSLIKIVKNEITKKVQVKPHLDGQFPDLILFIKDKVVIVELKRDKSFWKKQNLIKQIDKYNTKGKQAYKDKFYGVILCSEAGRYGVSFKDLIKELKSI